MGTANLCPHPATAGLRALEWREEIMFFTIVGFILTPVWIAMVIWPEFREAINTRLDIVTVVFFEVTFKLFGKLERKKGS